MPFLCQDILLHWSKVWNTRCPRSGIHIHMLPMHRPQDRRCLRLQNHWQSANRLMVVPMVMLVVEDSRRGCPPFYLPWPFTIIPLPTFTMAITVAMAMVVAMVMVMGYCTVIFIWTWMTTMPFHFHVLVSVWFAMSLLLPSWLPWIWTILWTWVIIWTWIIQVRPCLFRDRRRVPVLALAQVLALIPAVRRMAIMSTTTTTTTTPTII